MSELTRYPSYKDSGVPWLGEIPSHWHIKRLKFAISNISQKVDAKSSGLRYFGLENIESFTGKLLNKIELTSEGVAHQFEKNDVLFGKLRPYLAKVYLAETEGLSSTEALIFRPSSDINPKFLFYYCLSQDFINEVNGTTFGSKMPRANWDNISSLPTAFPCLHEQTLITKFLDNQLEKIDAIIRKQEVLLQKVTEQRSAVISYTVTKGMKRDIPTKDSNINWIGDIPQHWHIKQLKFVISCNDEVLSEQCESDYELLYIDISSVSLLEGVQKKEKMLFADAPSRARRIVRSGDILVSTVRTYLKAITYINEAEHNLIASTGFAVLRPKTGLNSKFLGYWIQSEVMIGSIVANSVGVSYPAINSSDLIRLPIILPTSEEQIEIVNYLDEKTERLDCISHSTRNLIKSLKEYRSILITQAVTGKIDVRDFNSDQQGAA